MSELRIQVLDQRVTALERQTEELEQAIRELSINITLLQESLRQRQE